MGDGDGWVHCASGHRHWGRFGAAGLLISDGHRVILQHRAPWTHEGDTWALPGGARDSHEDPTSTALREANEEAAIEAPSVEPIAMRVDDHGGWSYTTVLARPIGVIVAHAANAESTEVRWWGMAEVDGLALHHGFAATWPHVRRPPPRLLVIIDVRADPRLATLLRDDTADRRRLRHIARHGIPRSDLPPPLDAAGASVLLPRIIVVGDQARPSPAPAPVAALADADWWSRAITIAASTTSSSMRCWTPPPPTQRTRTWSSPPITR